MRPPRNRLRTLMLVVAAVAVLIAATLLGRGDVYIIPAYSGRDRLIEA
jgi:hypothetical protein